MVVIWQRNQLYIRLLILTNLLSVISFGCKKTAYQSIDGVAEVPQIKQSISCSEELSEQVEIKNPKTTTLQFASFCATDATFKKSPADIVFVIDVTKSMEDSLSTVKNGVERLANQLRQEKGWDARFAAIGFRDSVVAQIPFEDEKQLTERIKDWEAEGGDDLPEGSQFALAASIELLKLDLTAKPERKLATKMIFFIGDAIGFALNNDHADFSTGRLERIFSTMPESLKSQLKFYHSSAKEVEVCTQVSLFGCAKKMITPEFAAFKQMSEFAKKMNLSGKSFDFPFTERVMLNEFTEEFNQGENCSLKSAILKDQSGTEIALLSNKEQMSFPRDVKSGSLSLEIGRCCAASQKAGTEVKSEIASGCVEKRKTIKINNRK